MNAIECAMTLPANAAGAQIVFHVEGEMTFQFCGKLTLSLFAMKQTKEPQQPAA
jgi:hypothetical protein